MPPLLVIVRNLCTQGKASEEILESIEGVHDLLSEALKQFHAK